MNVHPYKKIILASFVLLLSLLTIGINLPVTDRDEARFVTSSKQMMQENTYLDIPHGEGKRYKKPIGTYWLQVLSVKIFGGQEKLNQIFYYRLPSIVAALAVFIGMYFMLAHHILRPENALITAMIASSTLITRVVSFSATADSVLYAASTIAICALYRIYLNHHKSYDWLLLWVLSAICVLIKGPLSLFIIMCCIVIPFLRFQPKNYLPNIRFGVGGIIFLIFALPWFIYIQIISDGAFLQASLSKDFIGKLSQGQEGHGAPFGLHTMISPITLFPWILLLINIKLDFLNSKRGIFLVSWFLPYWFMCEFFSTKLPHYTMLSHPALWIAFGHFLEANQEKIKGLNIVKNFGRGFHSITFGFAITVLSLAFLNPSIFPLTITKNVEAIVMLMIVALISYFLSRLWHNPFFHTFKNINFGFMFLSILAPNIENIWITERIIEATSAQKADLYIEGYNEASLNFRHNGRVIYKKPDGAQFQSNDDLKIYVRKHSGNFVPPHQSKIIIHGKNYSNGKTLTLDVYRNFTPEN